MHVADATTTDGAVRVTLITLDMGEEMSTVASSDALIVLVEGEVVATVGGGSPVRAHRSDPLESDPWIASLTRGENVLLAAASSSTIAVTERRDGHRFVPEPIPLATFPIPLEVRGSDADERRVRDFGAHLGLQMPIGETVCDRAWSTYPPHKHDEEEPGVEAAVQELLTFQIRPRSGFGLYLNYPHDGGLDAAETRIVQNGSIVACTGGYHSVVVASGYTMYYLWAGDGCSSDIRHRNDRRFQEIETRGKA